MKNLVLNPVTKNINVRLNLPGSKSIANRALVLAAIAHGTSVIHNVPDVSEDVQIMLKALQLLGVRVNKLEKVSAVSEMLSSSYEIEGCGEEFRHKGETIFCGNSGTTIRFLTAVLALMPGSYTLTGTKRMHERPIGDLIDSLLQLGAEVSYVENHGYPPIKTGVFTDNIVDEITVSGKTSSQYLTGLLMALPILGRDIKVKVIDELISRPYIEITLALMNKFGCRVEEIQNNVFLVRGSYKPIATEYTIEPDASSASYFLAMASLNGKVRIDNLSMTSLQGDKHFAQVLAKMGAKVDYMANSIMVRSQGRLNGISIDMESMPDVAMTIATLAVFADGITTITGVRSWKVKETDRLLAMKTELTKLGARVDITDDSITIDPPKSINSGVSIDTYDDHRMAMCFSLVAIYGHEIVINDYNCVGKTFANYFDIFNKICY